MDVFGNRREGRLDPQVRMHQLIDDQLWCCIFGEDLGTDLGRLQFLKMMSSSHCLLLSFQRLCMFDFTLLCPVHIVTCMMRILCHTGTEPGPTQKSGHCVPINGNGKTFPAVEYVDEKFLSFNVSETDCCPCYVATARKPQDGRIRC